MLLPTWIILKNALIEVEAIASRFKSEQFSSWLKNRDAILNWIERVLISVSNPLLASSATFGQNGSGSSRQMVIQSNATNEESWDTRSGDAPGTNNGSLLADAPAESPSEFARSVRINALQPRLYTTLEISGPNPGTSSFSNNQEDGDFCPGTSVALITLQVESLPVTALTENHLLTPTREEPLCREGRNAIPPVYLLRSEGSSGPDSHLLVHPFNSLIASLEHFDLNQEGSIRQICHLCCWDDRHPEKLAPDQHRIACMHNTRKSTFADHGGSQDKFSFQNRQNSQTDNRGRHWYIWGRLEGLPQKGHAQVLTASHSTSPHNEDLCVAALRLSDALRLLSILQDFILTTVAVGVDWCKSSTSSSVNL
ncbi:hypothetical protein R1flu_010013 [Riccia fluitans]|uniref:Uncharacterized protein n=1 Tax=Riccia fluitans TaxID=41844 RepID=A0ABD1Z3S9_9MARC